MNDQNYYLVQMQQELDNARRHIDMLTNQSQKAADELNRLRNQGAFVAPNSVRPPPVAPWSGPLPPPPVRPPFYNIVHS